MAEEYTGPERRQDYLALDSAIEDVQKLHGAVTTLATAVTNTVPRYELDELKAEVRRDYLTKIYFMAGFTAAAVIILLFFFNSKINNLKEDVRRGHDVITCLQTKPEAERTGSAAATAKVLCEQTAN